jgi:hypothetical protein
MAVVVYSEGFMTASACAPAGMSGEEVAAEVNAVSPTGMRTGWSVSEDKRFRTGEPMPAPCDTEPRARRHWLLSC